MVRNHPRFDRTRAATAMALFSMLLTGGSAMAAPSALKTVAEKALARSQQPASGPVIAGKTTLFSQTNNDSVADVYVNGNPSTCRTGAITISQWFANKYSSNGQNVPISWNLGDFTGFYVSNNLAMQVGLTNSQYGGTGIQVEGGRHGWQIETTTATPPSNDPGFIAGIIGNAQFCNGSGGFQNIAPFTQSNRILTYSVDLQVPYSNPSGGTVNTSAQMMYFIDPTVPPAGLGFWYSFTNYSSIAQSEQVIYDIGTDSAIVGALIGAVGDHSIDIGGTKTQFGTWSGDRRFHVAMTAVNLRNAIRNLKAQAAQNPTYSKYMALSDDPSVYIIGGGILDTEVARVNGYHGGMGLSARNHEIAIYDGNMGCTAGGNAVGWTCGGGAPNSQWVDVGGGCYMYDSGVPCRDQINGNVDSVTSIAGGGTRVSGWACTLGKPDAIAVHVYAGTSGAQTAIGGGAAWNWSEPAVGAACVDANNSPHRYTVDLDANTTNAYRGQKIYVFGVDGSRSALVNGSGVHTIP